MGKLKNIVYISKSDFEDLYENGTTTLDNGTNYNYDSDDLYMIPDSDDDYVIVTPSEFSYDQSMSALVRDFTQEEMAILLINNKSYIVYKDSSETYILRKILVNSNAIYYSITVVGNNQVEEPRIVIDISASKGYLSNETISSGNTLPTYDNSKENYVLSVDSNGALVWKSPYNGAASGS